MFEMANFPIRCRENYFFAALSLFSLILLSKGGNSAGVTTLAQVTLMASIAIIIIVTFIFTAPVIGRVTLMRRNYLILIHDVLFRFMESIDWLTGTNNKGYIMHLTATKLLFYEYVKPETMEKVCSMAIVRNPYSRMVSVYMYNRFGHTESFPHFVKSWYKLMIHYRTSQECEEYYTPCHCIPQFEFTHSNGMQLVQSVVKQEELKFLKTKDGAEDFTKRDSSVRNLPDPVREALLGMPHTNKRKTDKKWWDYFDQETLDLTFEMYEKDFEVFDYDKMLKQRPDLLSPTRNEVKEVKNIRKQQQSMLRNSSLLSSREKSARMSAMKASVSGNGRGIGAKMLSTRTMKMLSDEFDEAEAERMSTLSESTSVKSKDA